MNAFPKGLLWNQAQILAEILESTKRYTKILQSTSPLWMRCQILEKTKKTKKTKGRLEKVVKTIGKNQKNKKKKKRKSGGATHC